MSLAPRPAASLTLLIDAAQAFGSGTHPTTEGCLRAMQMIRQIAPRRVLDMGCGSAILAMAAPRLWPSCQTIAADNDPVAVRVAARNRALNAIAPAKNATCRFARIWQSHCLQPRAL